MKHWTIILAGLVIVTVGVWSYTRYGSAITNDSGQKPKKPKPLVITQIVAKGEISNLLDLTGSVEPTRIAKLASPAEGPITDAGIREGDEVHNGQKLLSIGRKRATEAMLASAEQDLKTERDELNRIEKLVETGAIPKDQLQLAKAKYYRMMAQAEKMKESSGDFEIVAPWRGIVSKVLVTDGNYVAARNVLLEMFDPESLVIRVAVPEAKSQEISPEMSVTVKLDAYNGHVFSGKVARIFPELDRRMRTRLVEVEPRENVKLIPGMFARVSLKLKSEKDATVVPTEAITVTPNGARIAYVVEDDKAVQRRVQVGLEGEGKVQILSGLSQGENVITAGNEKLKDGIEIRVQTEKKQGDKSKPKINAERGEDGKK